MLMLMPTFFAKRSRTLLSWKLSTRKDDKRFPSSVSITSTCFLETLSLISTSIPRGPIGGFRNLLFWIASTNLGIFSPYNASLLLPCRWAFFIPLSFSRILSVAWRIFCLISLAFSVATSLLCCKLSPWFLVDKKNYIIYLFLKRQTWISYKLKFISIYLLNYLYFKKVFFSSKSTHYACNVSCMDGHRYSLDNATKRNLSQVSCK